METVNSKKKNKKKGHQICPRCKKETFLIMHYGEAEYWCRKCRKYFKINIEKE